MSKLVCLILSLVTIKVDIAPKIVLSVGASTFVIVFLVGAIIFILFVLMSHIRKQNLLA